jgi:hypothetical protein
MQMDWIAGRLARRGRSTRYVEGLHAHGVHTVLTGITTARQPGHMLTRGPAVAASVIGMEGSRVATD